ncbi:MAG: hypothetical protein HY916_03900 [Desulfovibrio sp.]|jgi:hypothetical protein|nr:hypothetical protein [Desulfovibrio sp.]
MHPAFLLLDKALELGRQELAHLAAGEVEQAEALAFGRDSIISEALSEDSLASPVDQSLDELLAKLIELKELQARIINEADRLKQDISLKLRRADQEGKRHAGYGRATRPTPLQQSRFISQSS